MSNQDLVPDTGGAGLRLISVMFRLNRLFLLFPIAAPSVIVMSKSYIEVPTVVHFSLRLIAITTSMPGPEP